MKALFDKYWWIAGIIGLVAVILILPKSCQQTTESTTAMLTALNVTIDKGERALVKANDIITRKTDSLWTLRKQLATVKGSVITITEVITELYPDTAWLDPGRPEYIAMTDTAITRTFTLNDSAYAWVDDIALAVIVRDGSVDFRFEFQNTEIRFNTEDLETTLGLSIWYYVAYPVLAILAYMAGSLAP